MYKAEQCLAMAGQCARGQKSVSLQLWQLFIGAVTPRLSSAADQDRQLWLGLLQEEQLTKLRAQKLQHGGNQPAHLLLSAAVGKDTTLTWRFPNIRERKPLLTSTPLVKTGGDGTVSMQSLKQCFR